MYLTAKEALTRLKRSWLGDPSGNRVAKMQLRNVVGGVKKLAIGAGEVAGAPSSSRDGIDVLGELNKRETSYF